MDVYGWDGFGRDVWASTVVERVPLHPASRRRQGFADGDVFDLGGTSVEAVHLPGHTRGHSGFRISAGVFFLSDIDLTGFGPYYGDAWSDLEDFEASLAKVRDEDADFYVTFHHKGVIEGREEFLALLDAFAEVIPRRHEAMLDFLAEPHSLDELAAHRFVYRKHVESASSSSSSGAPRTCTSSGCSRRGEAREVDPGLFRRVTRPISGRLTSAGPESGHCTAFLEACRTCRKGHRGSTTVRVATSPAASVA